VPLFAELVHGKVCLVRNGLWASKVAPSLPPVAPCLELALGLTKPLTTGTPQSHKKDKTKTRLVSCKTLTPPPSGERPEIIGTSTGRPFFWKRRKNTGIGCPDVLVPGIVELSFSSGDICCKLWRQGIEFPLYTDSGWSPAWVQRTAD
jgi:hypothetical protein